MSGSERDNLHDRFALACQRTLLHSEGRRLQVEQTAVRGNLVTYLDLDDVSRNQLRGGKLVVPLPISKTTYSLALHLLQRLEGIRSIVLLPNTNNSIDNED